MSQNSISMGLKIGELNVKSIKSLD